MSSWWEYVDQPLSKAIGWTLLHSLWEGAAIGILFAFARLFLRNYTAQTRYVVGCAALALVLFAAAVTFETQVRRPAETDRGTMIQPSFVFNETPGASIGASFGFPLSYYVSRTTPVLTLSWMFGVVLLSARLGVHGWRVRTLRFRDNVPVDAATIELLVKLCSRLDIERSVRAVRSFVVQVPTVIGWLKPVILLPASTLSGLTPAQLETILAHELAHVKRHDYLVNACQCAIETLMFYHPVVWWISHSIREERENCCDDLVVQVCGNRMIYARALASLEATRAGIGEFAFSATGGSLLNRVRRLMGLSGAQSGSAVRQAGGFALIACGLVLLVLGAIQYNEVPKYVSTTRIRLQEEPILNLAANDGKLSLKLYDPYAIQNAFEIIQSDPLLEKTVQSLNLNEKWGQRFGSGSLKTSKSIALLRHKIDLRPIRNASYLEIRLVDEHPQDAADLANAVTKAYVDYRRSQRQSSIQSKIGAVAQQMHEQEKKIAAQQKVVDDLRDQLGISGSVNDSATGLVSESMQKLFISQNENEALYVKEKTLLENLKSLPAERLEQVLPTAATDSLLASLLEQRSFAEQKLLQVTRDYGADHPELQKTTALINDLRNKISARIAGIMVALEERVKALKAASDHIAKEIQAAKEQIVRSRPYFEAKQKLEELQRFYQLLAVKTSTEIIEDKLPDDAVQIMEDARVPSRAIAPNHPRATTMMLLGAVLIVTGLFVNRGRRATAAPLPQAA